jgi:hypothetical protein
MHGGLVLNADTCTKKYHTSTNAFAEKYKIQKMTCLSLLILVVNNAEENERLVLTSA